MEKQVKQFNATVKLVTCFLSRKLYVCETPFSVSRLSVCHHTFIKLKKANDIYAKIDGKAQVF